MQTVLHHMTLPEGVPEWVHLCPAGVFTGADGRGPYALKNPAAVIKASMAGGKLPIDEMHATDRGAVIGAEARARGWIVGMEARADGLWGHVDWTPTGQKLMQDKEYRGISPAWPRTASGEVTQILRASLTNAPNLTLTSLHNQETQMDLARLRAALGLPETADETAILAAVTANRGVADTHTAQLAAIATAAGLDGALPHDRLVVELQSRRGASDRITQMATTIVELQTQVDTMKANGSRQAATAFIDAAIRAGKPIVKLRDHYIEQHTKDPARVETEINAMISINAGGVPVLNGQLSGGAANDGLTDTDRDVASKMGLDPAKFAAFKKSRAEPTDGRAA